MTNKTTMVSYIYNPALKTTHPDWKGTPQVNGRFVNHEFPFQPKTTDVFRWLLSKNPQKKEKQKDSFSLSVQTDTSFLHQKEDCIVWIGHATFFIRIQGVTILTDPVFYKVPFVTRDTPPSASASWFKNLDYILISHDHQDHCQKKSLTELALNNPGVTVLAGLEMQMLLKPWIGEMIKIDEAGWYQQFALNKNVQITFLPARHWSKRSINDTNKRLWGGFAISAPNKTIYFSGDTGYGSHFKEIATLLPPIDVAIIGIGAFRPEWFMAPNHISPTDAIKAFNEMQAKVFIPMHYGTLDLSDEPIGEPLRILQQEEKTGKMRGKLRALDPGEVYRNF